MGDMLPTCFLRPKINDPLVTNMDNCLSRFIATRSLILDGGVNITNIMLCAGFLFFFTSSLYEKTEWLERWE
jgi:hypothetical protein